MEPVENRKVRRWKWAILSVCLLLAGVVLSVGLQLTSFSVGASNSGATESAVGKEHLLEIHDPYPVGNGIDNRTLSTERTVHVQDAIVLEVGQTAESHDHVKRSWSGHLEPKLLEMGRAFQEGRIQSFSYPLFDGHSAEISILSFKELGRDRGVIAGSVSGYVLSHVVLSQVGDAEGGTIQIPELGAYYEIRNGPEPGSVIVSEIDIHAIGECGVCAASAEQGALPPL